MEGNSRFIKDREIHPHLDAHRRAELESGQHPRAIVLSCSDSRVPPELIFDQGLGDLFTIRVAGNVLGAPIIASIEYAVMHLNASVILVLGHESCGAVSAALRTPRNQSAGSSDLDAIIHDIQSSFRVNGKALKVAPDDKLIREPVILNVQAVAQALMQKSAVIRNAVKAKKLTILRGIYTLHTGQVDYF
jgi:carbonic anhydrase